MGQPLLKIDRDGDALPLALILPDDLPFDAWVSEGRRLCVGHHALQWHIGDWWRYGVAHYGEEATREAAGDIWGVESETARVYGWVASKFDPVNRLTDLSFTHYQRVAALPREDAVQLINRAANEGMTVRDLYQVVREARAGSAPAPDRQVRSISEPPPDAPPVPKNELAEAYSRYIEAMEALEKLRPLTRREQDFLTVALDYLGEAHAERRPVPDDFDVIFVEKGRLECESHYRASRITINRWLVARGKGRLIDERAAYVKYQRAHGKGPSRPAGAATASAEPPVDTYLPVARMAADYLRTSRYGGWHISRHPSGNGWFVGTAVRSSEELIMMAERQGFDREAATMTAREEGY